VGAARRRAGALLLGGLLLVGPLACSDTSTPPEARESSPGPSAPPPRLPLTGAVAPDGVPDRPALVVKVDNTASAAPQVGLARADLVVEELVEGGATRLAVFLQSSLPARVGPVRSIRTSDIGVVGPTGGVLVASGAAGLVRRAVAEAGVRTAVEGAPGFARDGGRSAPYNLMVSPRALVKGLSDPPGPPSQPYLPWGEEKPATARQGKPVSRAEVAFSPGQTTRWRHADRGWTREDGLAAARDDFVADQVLVLRVGTRDAGYRDPAGNRVPETVTTGSGAATLLLDGRRVDARWQKDGPRAPFRLTTRGGEKLTVPPGHTWVELLPRSGSLSTS
jgi:hypothetical protein